MRPAPTRLLPHRLLFWWGYARRGPCVAQWLRLWLISGLISGFLGLGTAMAAVLPPEEAFPFQARLNLAENQLRITYTLPAHYYLYRERFRFEPSEGLHLEAVNLPEGETIEDEFFGPMVIYRDTLHIDLALQAPPEQRTGQLILTSQGCAEKAGVCYPPQTTTLDIDWVSGQVSGPPKKTATGFLAGLSERVSAPFLGSRQEAPAFSQPQVAANPSASPEAAAPQPAGFEGGDPTGEITRLLTGASTGWVLLSFFGFGLLLSLTPCTFPMIPILSGMIMGQGPGLSRGRGFGLSLAYVLGMATSYALAGLVAGLTGTFLAAALQNVWVLGGFALLFVGLALAMFGFFTLQLPSSLQTRLSEGSGRFIGKGLVGLFLMGMLSALILGPCMAAPLAAALLYIAQTGDAALGASALFAMGLGMGVPLLAVGMAAQTLLPRIGPWMEGVKKAFGVLLLGLALWFITPLAPAWFLMLGWGLLAVFSGLYLHALEALPRPVTGVKRFWQGVGLVLFVWGLAILVGLAAGGRDPLQPLTPFQASAGQGMNTAFAAPVFHAVDSPKALERALEEAAGRAVLLVFSADWCVSCRQMERTTFQNPRVLEVFAGMHLLKADVTQNTEDHQALLRQFGLFGPPGFAFFDAQGRYLPALRPVGYVDPPAFLRLLAAAHETAP